MPENSFDFACGFMYVPANGYVESEEQLKSNVCPLLAYTNEVSKTKL